MFFAPDFASHGSLLTKKKIGVGRYDGPLYLHEESTRGHDHGTIELQSAVHGQDGAE